MSSAEPHSQAPFPPRGFGGQVPELVTHEITDTVAFSPDGTLLASGGGSEVGLWSRRTRRVVAVLRGPATSGGSAIAFSPDGRWLASACYNGTLLIWDVATRQLHRTIRMTRKRDSFSRLAWTSSSDTLVSADANGTVSVWSVSSGSQVREFPTLMGNCRALAVSPDDRWVALGADSGLVVWDWRTARVAYTDSGAPIDSVGFTRDGKWLAVEWWPQAFPPRGFTLRLLALPSFTAIETGATGVASAAVLHTRNSVIYRVGGRLLEWNPATRRSSPLPSLPPGDRMVISPDDAVVVVNGGNRGRPSLCSLATGALLPPFEGQQDLVADLQFLDSPHRLFLRTCHALLAVDVASEASFLRLPCDRGFPQLARASRDGRYVALDEDAGLAVWDLAEGRRVAVLPDSASAGVADFRWLDGAPSLSVALISRSRSPEGSRVLKWDPLQGRVSVLWAGRASEMNLHPTGRAAVLSVPGPEHEFFNLANGRSIHRLPGLRAEAFSPDGQFLAGAQGAATTVWIGPEATTEVALRRQASDMPGLLDYRNPSPWPPSFVFSRDSRLLARLDMHSIRIWDLSTLAETATTPAGDAVAPSPVTVIDTPEVRLYYAVFSPDGKTLLVRGEESAVRVYDTKSGARLGTLSFLHNATRWFFITPDGRYDGSEDILATLDVLVGGKVQPLSAFDPRHHVPLLLASILQGERPPPSPVLQALPSAPR